MDIVERLREWTTTVRRNPKPLFDVIPMVNQAADEIESLRRQLDECRKDAERYRWLRDRHDEGDIKLPINTTSWLLDTAIDDAMEWE